MKKAYHCLVAKSCLTLCDTMNCSPPGSSVSGVFQARILEYSSYCHFLLHGDLPDPGIEPTSPALAGEFYTSEPPGKSSNKDKNFK